MNVYSFDLLCLWLLFYYFREIKFSRLYEDLKSRQTNSTLAHELIDELSDFRHGEKENEKKDSQHGLLIRDLDLLASIYGSQGRYKEAEDVQLRMIDVRPSSELDATQHLFLSSHLASIYLKQG